MKCVHLQQMRRWKRFNLLDPKAKIRWSGILHWWWPLSSGNRWLEAKGLERIQLDATSFFYKIIRYAGAVCLAKTLLDQHDLSVSRHLGGPHFHIPGFGYQLRILLIGLEAFFFRVKISLILQFFFFWWGDVYSFRGQGGLQIKGPILSACGLNSILICWSHPVEGIRKRGRK